MPREIDCPDCATDGEIFDEDLSLWVDCQTCDTTGKITVYTQAEINEAVKQEREEILNIIRDASLFKKEGDSFADFTLDNRDIQIITGFLFGIEQAIRAKGE